LIPPWVLVQLTQASIPSLFSFSAAPVAVVTVPIHPIFSGVPVGAGWVVAEASPPDFALELDPQAAATRAKATVAATTANTREECLFVPAI
jgi:hypothetical protein